MDVVVYFFLLGVLARLVKSDLRLPEALYETLSIYLLLAIGLKGGIELSKQPLAALAPQVAACMALGFAIPFALFPLLRILKISRPVVSPPPRRFALPCPKRMRRCPSRRHWALPFLSMSCWAYPCTSSWRKG